MDYVMSVHFLRTKGQRMADFEYHGRYQLEMSLPIRVPRDL